MLCSLAAVEHVVKGRAVSERVVVVLPCTAADVCMYV